MVAGSRLGGVCWFLVLLMLGAVGCDSRPKFVDHGGQGEVDPVVAANDKINRLKQESEGSISVRLQLPRMSCGVCEQEVRDVLTTVSEIQHFELDSLAKTALIEFDRSFDLVAKIEELKMQTSKLMNWSVID